MARGMSRYLGIQGRHCRWAGLCPILRVLGLDGRIPMGQGNVLPLGDAGWPVGQTHQTVRGLSHAPLVLVAPNPPPSSSLGCCLLWEIVLWPATTSCSVSIVYINHTENTVDLAGIPRLCHSECLEYCVLHIIAYCVSLSIIE